MENILQIGKNIIGYSDIEVSSYEDGNIVVTTVQGKEIRKKINTLKQTSLISLYEYCKHRGNISWFKQNIGLNKLPQEYRFMEL